MYRARKMHAPEHGIHHVRHHLLFVDPRVRAFRALLPLRIDLVRRIYGITPHRRLLGQYGGKDIRRDMRIFFIVRLIGRGNQIIASNDDSMVGEDVDKYNVIKKIKETGAS